MRRTFIFSMVLAGTLAVHAASYDYLTIERLDGTKVSLTAQGLTITFSNGNLIAGNTTISLSELSRMYFTSTDEGTETAIAAPGTDLTAGGAAEVYDMSGRRMPATATLPKGIYIIRRNGTTTKVQIK